MEAGQYRSQEGTGSLPKIKFARVLDRHSTTNRGRLPLPVADWMIKALKDDIQELKNFAEQMKDRYKVEGFGEIDAESFPPCIPRLITMARSGVTSLTLADSRSPRSCSHRAV